MMKLAIRNLLDNSKILICASIKLESDQNFLSTAKK